MKDEDGFEVIRVDDAARREYWDERVAIRDNKRSVRVDGVQYMIADEHSEFPFRGFGGQDYYIRFIHSDIFIHSTNLWLNGSIPEQYRDRLFDNAEFISKEEFDVCVANPEVRGELLPGVYDPETRFAVSKNRNPDLPSSGEVARDDTSYRAEQGHDHRHDNGNDNDRGRS